MVRIDTNGGQFMQFDIFLHDGTLVDSPYLSIMNPALPLTAQRRRDLALASRHQGLGAGVSVVLVKNERLLAAAYGHETLSAACAAAKDQLIKYYERKHWPLPDKGVVAFITPFPVGSLINLAACGVDTVFAEQLKNDTKPQQQAWIDAWLRPRLDRPDEFYRRAFITRPFVSKR